MKIKCRECKSDKYENDFYRIIRENKNEKGVYIPYIVCKDCIIKEYLNNAEDDFHKGLLYICEKYNVYYDINLANSIISSEIPKLKVLFGKYIRYISSLSQYQNKKFKDSVFKDEIKSSIGKYSDILIPVDEKSDIDFINDDIKELKIKISKALQKEDFNAHNKWMNSLRDALELRDRLQGNNDCTINIGTIMVKDDSDINKLSEELTKLAKRNVNLS